MLSRDYDMPLNSTVILALTIVKLLKWYSAWISKPSKDEGVGSNPGTVPKKIVGTHLGDINWVWPSLFRVSEVEGRYTTLLKAGFLSEDSMLSSSPMSFYLFIYFYYFQNYVRIYFLNTVLGF